METAERRFKRNTFRNFQAKGLKATHDCNNVEKSQTFDFSVFYSFLLRTNFATRCTPVHRRVPQSRGFGLSLCVPNNFTYPLMVGCLKTLFLNSPFLKKMQYCNF